MLEAVKEDEQTVKMLAEIDADLEQTLFPHLRILAQMPDASTKEMHKVCSYIYWAEFNHIKLKFGELT